MKQGWIGIPAEGEKRVCGMPSEIAKRQLGLKILGAKFELLPNALIVHGKPSTQEYDEAFRRLSSIESATSWWWGDLANARERHYGSLKETAEKYGKDYNSLHVCQYVSSRYKVVNRFTTLGFRHHQIAAPLEDRLEWLKRHESEESRDRGHTGAKGKLTKGVEEHQKMADEDAAGKPILGLRRGIAFSLTAPRRPVCGRT